jgi:spermidine/putrescine transport system substrate-binding protein
LNRSRVVGWVILLSVFVLVAAACSRGNQNTGGGGNGTSGAAYPSSPPASQDKGPLKVLTFSGDDDPKFDKTFQQQYPNANVQYQTGDSNDDFFSKVSTGSVDADVIYGVCVNYLPNWQKAKLIAPIDTTRMSNWSNLNTDAEKLGQIGGKQWETVSYYGYDSIVSASNEGAVPTSWADLWNPQFKDQFSMINYAENGVQMTAVALGLPYPDLSDQQLNQVKEKLLALKPNIRSFWTNLSDPIQQLGNGDVKMFYGWPSQYATLQQDGKKVEYLDPSEGRLSWSCGAVVNANTQHYNLALAWINGRVSAQSGALLVNTEDVGSANTTALEQANQDIVKGLGYDDPAIFAKSHPAVALTDEQRQKFNQLWTEVIGS